MSTNNERGLVVRREKAPTIALRINDSDLYERIKKLADEQHISVNMAVNMLLGFAFNEVDKQEKKFVPRIVFESK